MKSWYMHACMYVKILHKRANIRSVFGVNVVMIAMMLNQHMHASERPHTRAYRDVKKNVCACLQATAFTLLMRQASQTTELVRVAKMMEVLTSETAVRCFNILCRYFVRCLNIISPVLYVFFLLSCSSSFHDCLLLECLHPPSPCGLRHSTVDCLCLFLFPNIAPLPPPNMQLYVPLRVTNAQ
jgi:hypothetical protein